MKRKAKAYMYMNEITNKEIAKKAGVSETWVSLVVTGKGTSKRVRKIIADAVGMKVEELWDGKAA